MQTRPDAVALPLPPAVSPDCHSLFLDFDGTLVSLVDDPASVHADPELRELLAALNARFAGRLAIVSGRSIAQLDAMIGPLANAITVAGSHGAEIRQDGHAHEPLRPAGLDAAIAEARAFAAAHPAMIVEIKSQGVGLHYRMQPDLEADVRARARAIGAAHHLYVQPGKMMVELRGPGCDKGDAVKTLIGRTPMAGSLPVFLGDDLTDEAALACAQAQGGFGVLVGTPRATAADYGLADVADVRAWLWDLTKG
ncbi:trehalose-phosphatase [Sphingomonas montanisoli]|uniref:Trehalose 6-phosphate phosphatase n=1 Tax=Sphingomonas montanisoli TaxID=2606412 RepID=A0A5D9C320_9SPHN|nr:trehalose-phosphatase [Sphingomonas montanisoli]TZG25853.1 trehalose-phosphatase [Sphingomonas montanisoli]